MTTGTNYSKLFIIHWTTVKPCRSLFRMVDMRINLSRSLNDSQELTLTCTQQLFTGWGLSHSYIQFSTLNSAETPICVTYRVGPPKKDRFFELITLQHLMACNMACNVKSFQMLTRKKEYYLQVSEFKYSLPILYKYLLPSAYHLLKGC